MYSLSSASVYPNDEKQAMPSAGSSSFAYGMYERIDGGKAVKKADKRFEKKPYVAADFLRELMIRKGLFAYIAFITR